MFRILLPVVQVSCTKNKCQIQQDCAEEVVYEQKQPTSTLDCQIGQFNLVHLS